MHHAQFTRPTDWQSVIPAKAGIHLRFRFASIDLDAGLRKHDELNNSGEVLCPSA